MSRRDSQLRVRCEKLLSQLRIDVHPAGQVSISDIRDGVQRVRERPLQLIPVLTGPGEVTGMWVETEQADYVFFDQGTSPLHQLHIIFHEIGHMMLGHTGTGVGWHPHFRGLCRALAEGPAATAMLRTGHETARVADDDHEREAEVFATVACQRIGDVRSVAGGVPLGEDSDRFSRLTSILSEGAGPSGGTGPARRGGTDGRR